MMSRMARIACLMLALTAAGAMGAAAQPANGGDTSQAAQVEEATWPHTVTEAGATATIYEPQAISWPDLKTLTARTAVSITPPGSDTPFLGTIEMSVATDVDLGTHSVILTSPKLLSAHFPTLDAAQAARVEARIRDVMKTWPPKRVPLDTVLLSLKEPPPVGEAPVRNDPPKIFTSSKPASLVVFDGEPVLAPVAGTALSFAVNTNWDVFKDAGGTWYLLHGAGWLSAPAATGPWSPVPTLPAAFAKLPDNANFARVRKAVPGKPFAPGSAPTIFVSTVPAEIIVTDGPPRFVPVAGTGLESVANTDAALFLDPAGGRFYYLVSGRWFSAPGLDGPWTFATPDLPPDFAKISPESPHGNVLASVPGTPQAQKAVVQAHIPHQATLRRSAATLTVVYGGKPRFAPIPGTHVAYAVNTHYEVLRIGRTYYACYQGAWFKSASPTGPWVLADSVPAAVYKLPPSSPLYPVTYVRVYGATPQTVTYGYTAGYVMGYVSAGVLVYGTGYYYPPVVVPGPVPAFYPYPYSYAGGVYYNTASGAWARGGTVYGPYGAASAGAAYNPATGAWAGGAAVYGPYGGAGAWSAYNPSTGSYAHGSAVWGNGSGSANASWYNARTGVTGTTNQNANPYGRWGSSTFAGPNATVNTRSGSNAYGSAGAFSSSTGAAGAGVHGAGGNNAGVVRGANGNLYAGADGNVYRHTSDGWSKYNNGTWTPVQKPSQSTQNPTRNSATNPTTTATHQPAPSTTPQTATRQSASHATSQTVTHQSAPHSTSQAATHQTAPRSTSRTATHQTAPHATSRTAAYQPAHRTASRTGMQGRLSGSSLYGQLEQDRQARSFGAGQWQQHRFGGSGAGQGRFGGRGFGGGGGRRFR